MDTEASAFETSEMLGTFLASTPLLKEAWRLCGTANAMGPGAFVAEQVGGVGYVAFSGVQELPMLGWDPNYGMLVSLDAAGRGLFAPLKCHYEGEEPVMVHSGVLHLFLHHRSRPDFQSQIDSLLDKTKSIVTTGHLIGGSTTFLTALWLLSKLKANFPPVCLMHWFWLAFFWQRAAFPSHPPQRMGRQLLQHCVDARYNTKVIS